MLLVTAHVRDQGKRERQGGRRAGQHRELACTRAPDGRAGAAHPVFRGQMAQVACVRSDVDDRQQQPAGRAGGRPPAGGAVGKENRAIWYLRASIGRAAQLAPSGPG
jgi:hypothetical protein